MAEFRQIRNTESPRFLTNERKILTILWEWSLSPKLKMITSKLTSKAQTTIPRAVRAALRLEEGDELLYEIVGRRVIVTKVPRDKAPDDPFGTFDEWHSKADEQAYGNL